MTAEPNPAELDEDARLAGLLALGVLDTPRESDFDQITGLAAAICDVPMAMVSFIDRDRQWFKAAEGVDMRETPRSHSVCAHTMLGDTILEIPDTTLDPRTRDNPLVSDGRVAMKFYAGAPLISGRGIRLGALCVLDRQPRRLTPVQRQTLTTLAAQVITQIELRRALGEARETADRLGEALKLHDILVQEMDHRVRNSLQQVSSLLRLQAARTDSPEVKGELVEAQNRVAAIAAIHAALGHSGHREVVEMDTYFEKLSQNLAAALPPGVMLSMDGGGLRLGTSQASAIAIIANEFVANSIKYAFVGRPGGAIAITLRHEGDRLSVRFADDGIGVPEAQVAAEGSGLGMRIIEASAQQIDGTLTALPGPGTAMELRAPASLGNAD